jgi:uncharacterized membrane protein
VRAVRRRGAHRIAAAGTLGMILAATVVTLTVGALVKAPCANGSWGDGRQYRRLCYSDIVPLYGAERLTAGRLPYLNRCPIEAGAGCDEYPVLTMYFMRASAWISNAISQPNGYGAFFWTNAFLLGALALVTAALLWTMAGERALYFAVAPTLLIYAFVNWDLLAVALATAGTWAYLRNRDEASGVLLGLGAAAKLYPGLLVIPFALGRLKKGRAGGAASLVVWAGVAWAAVNIPFAIVSSHSWATFFRFNAHRPLDWDSLWFVACTRLKGGGTCGWSPKLMNALTLLAFVVLSVAAYAVKRARDPSFARWTFAFPLLTLFLLTNKVYSPQYGLWLLPWFVLALPVLPLFLAFEATDVAVFITRFGFFGRLSRAADPTGPFGAYGGYSMFTFQSMVVLRAAVLLACVVVWTLQRGEDPVAEAEPIALPAMRPALGAG